MAEIISIRVEAVGAPKVSDQLKKIKGYVDYLNQTKVTIKAETSGNIDKFTKQITAYNNSVARRVKAETQLATAIENRKAAESRAQAAHERTLQAEQRTAQAVERTKQATERTTQAATRLSIEQHRTAQAAQRTAQSEYKLAIERQRTAQATERTAQSENKLALQQERSAQMAAKEAAEQRRANEAMERGAQSSGNLATSLAGVVTRVFSLHLVLSRVVSAFREALQTMKDVDSALVTIQKTTGFTGEQLDRVAASAYDLANAYGRTATEVLNAASVYARAGFKDNLDQMTELSVLLQNVGDLESETASKFLIATNAAWKLGGSYEDLMSVIDGLNAQTNQAAVDMEGLTSGITVAGSVFSAAGESVQTFAGMLGAGIALTARSGSEIGRGLRTIAMNIRQIKGELDDGEIIDDESISDAAKALHSIGISVADANGQLRLTSEVLNELAGKWGNLTTAEQSYISQSLAGKRQANILVSLMQNWDEAQRQMALYANGAGSALQENEIYMDSWEAKTKQLSAAWTRFVSDLVDTDLIKGALDALITLVNLLDTGIGRLLVTSGGIATAVIAIIGLVSRLSSAITALNAVVAVNPIFLAIAGTTAGLYMLVQAFGSIETKSERLAREAEETASAYEDIQAEVEKLETNEENLTELEREKLALLREQAAIKKQAADEAAREKALYDYSSKYSGSLEASGYSGTYNAYQRKLETATREEANAILERMRDIEARAAAEGATQQAKRLISQHGGLLADMDAAKTVEDFRRLEEQAGSTYEAIVDMAVELSGFAEVLGDDVPQNLTLALNMLNAYIGGMHTAREETEETVETTAEVVDELRVKLKKLSDEADAADTAIAGVTSAVEDFGDGSVELYDAMRVLESTIPGSTDKLYDFETASLKIKAAQIADKESLLDFIEAAGNVRLQSMISEMEKASTAALELAGSIAIALPGEYNEQFLDAYRVDRNPALQKLQKDWDSWIGTLRQRSDYSGTSSTSRGSSSTSDPELEKRKEAVALLKSELEFLKAKGATQDELNAKQREIQAALHDQAEYMRLLKDTQTEITIKQSDINALSTEWWKIQSELSKQGEDELDKLKSKVALLKSELDFLRESGASEDEIIAKQREIQDALHKQAEYMRSIKADQTEIKALSTEWWRIQQDILKTQEDIFNTLKASIDEYYDKALSDKEKELEAEEKILAVQKAQIALENAQNERTVRYYNAATGQWERMADANKVKSAHDNLKNAQDALNQYNKQQAEDEFKKAWEYVAQKIKDGAMTFDQAYKYMYDKMKDIQDKYDVDMSGVLNDSIGGFKGLNITIRDLDKKTADELGKATELISQRVANLNTAMGKFKSAVDKVAGEVKSGKKTFEEAYDELKKKAKEIADKYGVDLTGALDTAVTKMQGVYSGLDGISKAVQEGALTPDEAFDIISKALNAVSEKYGENISKEVDAILEGENGFKGGLSGLVQAVKDGKIDINTAFGLVESATKKVSDKYGKDMTKELNSAIQNMGKSGDAIEDLWKQIVIAKMKANSVAWYDADEDERKALHAENEALGALIGADCDATGYWSLGGRHIYDPAAERGATGGTATAGGTGTTTTGRVKATPASVAGANATMANPLEGVNLDSLTPKQKATVLKSALTAGNWVDVMNTLNAAGDTPVDIGEDGTPTGMLHAIDGFVIGSKLVAVDGYVPHTGWEGTTTEHPVLSDLNGNYWMLDKETGELTPVPETATYKKLAQKVAFNEENVHAMYDSGGILRGMGGIKATDRDELILPPDITSKMLDPINNEYTMRAFDALRWMLGGTSMPSSTVNNRIGSQHNGNVYEIGGIRIGEERARSTTVYDIAQLAQSLSISKEGN